METEHASEAPLPTSVRATGPTTPDGKRRSSQNSRRHGLLARHVLMPDEDPSPLRELDREIRGALQPVGNLEELLVDRVVTAFWRLRRLLGIERDMMDADLADWLGFFTILEDLNPGRHRPTIGAAIGRKLVADDPYGKFCRYEAHIERTLYRALHELQRLQAARAGVAVPPPGVLDVQIAGPVDGPPVPPHLEGDSPE